ncbi:hypothetical protein CISG_09204 [Coccidioides immitis RMSCC 3703]|uniref:Protein kinase domain-containing protein n=1 Tax=Coccidioides immitis RMSCC 3703 TaxID=454286 RepID=A0A0J8R9Q0_COCIT|nr:hypothetical protein CISG_09204 [Coccidioides immitis RMSCC 3703]
MEAQLELLRKQLREEQRRREDAEALASAEQQQRANAEARALEERRQRAEEQRRREIAEALTKPNDLSTFLLKCHDLSLAIDIVTDPTQTTKGDTSKATRRYYPSRIVPCPITAEMDLRYYERDTVENQVQMVVNAVYEDETLKQAFRLAGSITFESHTNLGASKRTQATEEQMQDLSIDTDPSSRKGHTTRKGKQKATEDPPISRGQADRFCVYRRGTEEDIPAIAIEYKAPHKLTCDEIATGLAAEIQPGRDVINSEEDTSEFYSKRLATVVVTQLFSYMVSKGVQYGYICTGEVFVFLRILEDPSVIEYAICVPNQDVRTNHKEDFELTAVGQVIAFTMRALASPPPSQAWHAAASELGIWPVEYSEVLARTPSNKRLKGRHPLSSAYRGKKADLPAFHMQLRSCRPSDHPPRDRSPSPPPPDSPSPAQTPSTLKCQSAAKSRGDASQHQPRGGRQGKETGARVPIQDRPYCSQECLLGLRAGGPLDPSCPNFQDHRKKINPRSFLRRVRQQLAVDRGHDADCRPLYKAGSYGALFKVRLSSHGFTLVAKGATCENLDALVHERNMYNKLRDIQGQHVPVCLGIIKLERKRPYYYDGGVYTHMLMLSWAGRSITNSQSNGNLPVSDMVKSAFQAIHRRGVLHGDAEPRNILWNDVMKRLMIVDFGRASKRDPLAIASTNTRKRKLQEGKIEQEYTVELNNVQRSIDNLFQSAEARRIRSAYSQVKSLHWPGWAEAKSTLFRRLSVFSGLALCTVPLSSEG